ncbi:MAG: hypothetical protein H7A32_05295 [Deltaproteobacteria bacterium]|nr:hypothetical protein [Deltaproteobacteria bacterium]
MKKIFLFNIILYFFCISELFAAQVQVARFQYNGPQDKEYLVSAAQDAIVASLNQSGHQAQRDSKSYDPDSYKQKNIQKNIIIGRINVVGQQARVLIIRVNTDANYREKYIQVDNLDHFLPQIESYALNYLAREMNIVENSKTIEVKPDNQGIATQEKVQSDTSKESSPVVKEDIKLQDSTHFKKEPRKEENSISQHEPVSNEYQILSQRLPYEIRSIAYGDLDQDGIKELCVTSQNTLYIYHLNGAQLEKLTEYQGKSTDYFVKVDILPEYQGQRAKIALTNLKSNYASSKLFEYQANTLDLVVDKIPFQLRVLVEGQKALLLGASYNGKQEQMQSVYTLLIEGDKVRVGEKMKLPKVSSLYAFQKFHNDNSLLTISHSGKLDYYREQSGENKKIWSSQDSYGSHGNYIPISVKNVFNEVIASYYSIPVEIESIGENTGHEVLLVRSESMVKKVVGKVPFIADSQLVKLKWDEMGFSEEWMSKKVDGSIQDFLVDRSSFQSKVIIAVRLRQGGVFGSMSKNESIILAYDLP